MEMRKIGGLEQVSTKSTDNVGKLSEAARYQASVLPEDHERAKAIYKNLLDDIDQTDEMHRQAIKGYTLLLCTPKTEEFCDAMFELQSATINSESAKKICTQIAQTPPQRYAHFQIAMDYKKAYIAKAAQGVDEQDTFEDREKYLNTMYHFHLDIAVEHQIPAASLEKVKYFSEVAPDVAERYADMATVQATEQQDKDTLSKLPQVYEELVVSYTEYPLNYRVLAWSQEKRCNVVVNDKVDIDGVNRCKEKANSIRDQLL